MGGTAFAWGVIELVVFTTLAPSAAVAYGIVASRFLLWHADDRVTPPPSAALMVALALVTLGFVVSATHLGNPSNALYVLTRVGRAGLSDEVLSCAVFLALGGTFWVASLLRRPPKVVENLWLVATVASMVAYLVCTARVYCMPTIPTWNTAEAQASLVLEALAGGALLAHVLLAWDAGRTGTRKNKPPEGSAGKREGREGRALFVGSLLPAAAACIVLVLQHGHVVTLENAFGRGADLAPNYLAFVVLYAVGMLAANLLARAFSHLDTSAGHVSRRAALLSAPLLMYAATFLVRFEFYVTYMTSA